MRRHPHGHRNSPFKVTDFVVISRPIYAYVVFYFFSRGMDVESIHSNFCTRLVLLSIGPAVGLVRQQRAWTLLRHVLRACWALQRGLEAFCCVCLEAVHLFTQPPTVPLFVRGRAKVLGFAVLQSARAISAAVWRLPGDRGRWEDFLPEVTYKKHSKNVQKTT